MEKVAAFTEEDVDRLLQNEGIIRNKLKIRAAITNAQRFLEIQNEFGSFYNYLLTFFPDGKHIQNNWKRLEDIPASSPISDAVSKDMKRRGFKFFGTSICYAHLQAVGLINDHLVDCSFR